MLETIFSAYEAISFTENHIRQLHRDLLAYSTKDERHRGACKTLADMPEFSVTLLELTREHGRITVAEAARITDASR